MYETFFVEKTADLNSKSGTREYIPKVQPKIPKAPVCSGKENVSTIFSLCLIPTVQCL